MTFSKWIVVKLNSLSLSLFGLNFIFFRGDHTEAIELDFDPDSVSFEQLLKVFWRLHDPTMYPRKRQYM